MTSLPWAQQKKSAFLCSNTTLSLILSVVFITTFIAHVNCKFHHTKLYVVPHVLDLQIRRRAIASFTAKSKPPSNSTTENQDTFEMISKHKGNTQYFNQTKVDVYQDTGISEGVLFVLLICMKKGNNNTEGFQNRIGGVHQDKFEMLSQRRGET